MTSILQTSDWIKVDPWETSQKNWTRTLDVLKHFDAQLNRAYANSPESQSDEHDTAREQQKIHVKLLCGGDFVETFSKPGLWEDPETLLRRFGLVSCTSRLHFAQPNLTSPHLASPQLTSFHFTSLHFHVRSRSRSLF